MSRNAESPRIGRRELLKVGGAISIGGLVTLAGCSNTTPGDESDQADNEYPSSTDLPIESDGESGGPDNYIFTNDRELGRIRQRARLGVEPWGSALKELRTRAEAAVKTGSVAYDENQTRGNAPKARKVTRDAALGYYFFGEDRFAKSAIDKLHHFFLNEDTRYEPTDPVIPHTRIINSIVIPELLFAASLVRSHPYWDEKGGEYQLQEWCETYVETSKRYSLENHGDERTLYRYPQNRYEYRIIDRLANAAYMEDDGLFDQTVDLWKDFHNAKIPFPEARANLAVFPDGKRNDANRSEGWEYARYGLDATVTCAEIARHKGYDLYTWQDTPKAADIENDEYEGPREGPLIPRQFEWMNNIFFNPKEWNGEYRTRPPSIEPTARGVVAYEYGASIFDGSVLGSELARVLREFFERPAFNRKNTGHVTLTHGDLFRIN
ncbi:MAG: alginate lyase family protein, partial [Natronomonas sp.]